MFSPRRHLSTALLVTVSFAATVACTPGSGAIRLAARSGTVVDQESRAGIAEADVFQVYWGRGVAGEPRPAYALRWTTTDARGAFAFDEELSSEPRSWVLETDEAEYGFFHPDYGLTRRGRGDADAPLVLEGTRLDEARRRAEELNLCGSRPADEVLAALSRMRCSRRPR